MGTITTFIIIGIITTIYKNAKKSKNIATQPRPVSINRSDFQDAYKRLRENTAKKSPSAVQPESILPNEPVLVEVDKVEQKSYNSLRNEMNQVVKETHKAEKENEEFLINGFTEHKKLVDAVIWSEILGEPRSKKSYFAKRKY